MSDPRFLSPYAALRECAAGCGRRMFVAVDELTGGAGAPSGVDTLTAAAVEPAWFPVPDDTEDRMLAYALAGDPDAVTCWNCTPPAVRDAYLDELNENDEIIARLCEREALRREPTSDEAAADERARLVFGVEPFDGDDYGSLADTGP